MQLSDFFDIIHQTTDLNACLWSVHPEFKKKLLHSLPLRHQRHVSPFCRTVMNNNPSRNCNGHDNVKMLNRAQQLNHPFVNVCPAGAAEVIIPIRDLQGSHLAVVFIGQARLPHSQAPLPPSSTPSPKHHNDYLNHYRRLPVFTEKKLLAIGQWVELSITALALERELSPLQRQAAYPQHPAVKKALQMIFADPTLTLDESTIAAQLKLTQAHFSRLFKKELGYNFSEFITELRISKAFHLLTVTDWPILKISFECGYARQAYFTHIFKRVIGMPPSHVRRLNRQSPPSPSS